MILSKQSVLFLKLWQRGTHYVDVSYRAFCRIMLVTLACLFTTLTSHSSKHGRARTKRVSCAPLFAYSAHLVLSHRSLSEAYHVAWIYTLAAFGIVAGFVLGCIANHAITRTQSSDLVITRNRA